MSDIVRVDRLNRLSYDEAVALLERYGYILDSEVEDHDCRGRDYDYIADTYYVLYDDDSGEELDQVAFTRYMIEDLDPLNDDKSGDIVYKSCWQWVIDREACEGF